MKGFVTIMNKSGSEWSRHESIPKAHRTAVGMDPYRREDKSPSTVLEVPCLREKGTSMHPSSLASSTGFFGPEPPVRVGQI
jgi:hypothetical protein